MEESFWKQKWETNQLGFHKTEANPMLVKHFKELNFEKDSRIFVPMCGKTLDIAWLLSRGQRVVACELVEMAIEQLFIELGVQPRVKELGNLKHYSADGLDVFVAEHNLEHMNLTTIRKNNE